ncbi:MAG: HIT domain-containing protein, partial [Deltaproteobacteria bacterium]|nr:HIT domain-containing protein [Deltaproteobacteria bacterium]
MERIFAPWRMNYIRQGETKGCIFCEMKEIGVSPESLIVFMSEFSFVILNRYPYVSGHVMVVPLRHTGDIAGLSPEEFTDMMAVMRLSASVVGEAFKPQGLNIGMNLGKAAGAGIEDHLHVHIVPRK